MQMLYAATLNSPVTLLTLLLRHYGILLSHRQKWCRWIGWHWIPNPQYKQILPTAYVQTPVIRITGQ